MNQKFLKFFEVFVLALVLYSFFLLGYSNDTEGLTNIPPYTPMIIECPDIEEAKKIKEIIDDLKAQNEAALNDLKVFKYAHYCVIGLTIVCKGIEIIVRITCL